MSKGQEIKNIQADFQKNQIKLLEMKKKKSLQWKTLDICMYK